MADDDPDFYKLIARETLEQLATGTDNLAKWADEMIGSADGEEAVFLRGVRVYFNSADRDRRRYALASLAQTFRIKREDLKRYLRFKGIVNLMD